MVEYQMLQEASALRNFDDRQGRAHQAWLNQVVQNRKKSGEPMYGTFDKFFSEKEESIRKQFTDILDEEDNDLQVKSQLAAAFKRAKEGRK